MYILETDLFRKRQFRSRNLCCVGGIFRILIFFFCLFRNKCDQYLYLYIKNLQLQFHAFKTCHSVPNIYLNLYGQVENSKWIFCDWKSQIYFYERLKPVFEHLLNLCSRFVNSQRLFYSKQKLVWDVRIKAFWYT